MNILKWLTSVQALTELAISRYAQMNTYATSRFSIPAHFYHWKKTNILRVQTYTERHITVKQLIRIVCQLCGCITQAWHNGVVSVSAGYVGIYEKNAEVGKPHSQAHQISWLPDISSDYGASTLETVAVRNEMHVISLRFNDIFVSRSILAVIDHMQDHTFPDFSL